MAERRKYSKKYCKYTVMKIKYIDYKNIDLLKISMSERGKIMPRRLTGNSKNHQEMVEKSGGGINYLFQIIDNNNFNFELQEQKIARLLQEIANLENKLLELVTTYKFKNRFIIIEINKSLFIKKIQKQKFYNFLLFIYNKYSNIVFKSLHIKNFINIKKINLKNTMYILKVIVVISNLIYFINLCECVIAIAIASVISKGLISFFIPNSFLTINETCSLDDLLAKIEKLL